MTTVPDTGVDGVHTPPVHDRHPWLDELCGRLSDMAVGQAAQKLLTGTLPDSGTVVVLPTWSWALPAVDVGRKGISYDQEPLRLPVRMSYSCGPVLVHAEGCDDSVSWHGTGLGRTDAGRMAVTDSGDGPLTDDLAAWDAELPVCAVARCDAGPALQILLTRLVQKGEQARWELTADLERRFVTREMTAAAGRVVAEVTDGTAGGLDPVTIETLVNRFVWGDPDDDQPSKLSRMLQHMLVPSQFVRVDPGRWLVVAMRRDTERFIRKYLGDPGVGAKVRRVARELGLATLEELVEAYQELHPADRVAASRAETALSTSVGTLLAGQYLDTTAGREAS